MGYYCTVPQCTSLAGKTKNVKFHRFPRDVTMADKWNIILKRGKPYTKYSKVCSLHFTQNDYNVTTMGQWKTLSKDAVPSQNLPKLNPDGTVMVIRKSRTVKYREGKKEDSEKMGKSWSVMSVHGSHSLLSNGPDTPMPHDLHDNTLLAYRLQTLGAIANTISPTHPMPAGPGSNKPRKQDAIMQTDPVLNEDDDTQPNNSYSEVSDKSYSSELDQYNQSYPKDYPKEYPKESYPNDDSPYPKDSSPYPKDTSPYPKDSSPYPKDTVQYPRDSNYSKEYPKEQSPYPRDSPYKDSPSYSRDSTPYAKDTTYPKDDATYKDTSYPKDGTTYKDTSYPKDGATYKDTMYPKDTAYPKDASYKDTSYSKDGIFKESNTQKDGSYQKDNTYSKEDTTYQKAYESKSYEPKDYTKSSEDYIPQTNEEYNKEAERYALERKSHNGYDLKEYHKQVLQYQKIPEIYPFNRDAYFQNGFPNSAEVLRNQQHNLQILQEQHRINENQNFFNENYIKQEIDITDDDKFLYEKSKEQLESNPMYAERRLQQQRIFEHLQHQVKQEPDVPNGCSVPVPMGSPYYSSGGATGAGAMTGAVAVSTAAPYYDTAPRPGPELLIAKQNALAAHTQLWQNMKRPFFYSESPHYNTPLHRYEDISRILQ